RAMRHRNLYTVQLMKCPDPMAPFITMKQYFFVPVSRYGASESMQRFVAQAELPELLKVLPRLVKGGILPMHIAVMTTSELHRTTLNQLLEDTQSVYKATTPERYEGRVTRAVVLLGGRRVERYWHDSMFRRLVDSFHLDVFVAVGSCNPFKYRPLPPEGKDFLRKPFGYPIKPTNSKKIIVPRAAAQ
ncbi:hypothetical protein PFISCL1PPCAC_13950, partial [Pristionchus fissidentatus]